MDDVHPHPYDWSALIIRYLTSLEGMKKNADLFVEMEHFIERCEKSRWNPYDVLSCVIVHTQRLRKFQTTIKTQGWSVKNSKPKSHCEYYMLGLYLLRFLTLDCVSIVVLTQPKAVEPFLKSLLDSIERDRTSNPNSFGFFFCEKNKMLVDKVIELYSPKTASLSDDDATPDTSSYHDWSVLMIDYLLTLEGMKKNTTYLAELEDFKAKCEVDKWHPKTVSECVTIYQQKFKEVVRMIDDLSWRGVDGTKSIIQIEYYLTSFYYSCFLVNSNVSKALLSQPHMMPICRRFLYGIETKRTSDPDSFLFFLYKTNDTLMNKIVEMYSSK